MANESKRGGKRAGSGRKSKGTREELEGLLRAGWPYEKRLNHIKQLADANDLESIKLLLSYAYGKPTERKELSGTDGQPLRVVFEWVDNGIGGIGEGSGSKTS